MSTNAHRRTDPSCREFRDPTGWWSRWRYERGRGWSCPVCHAVIEPQGQWECGVWIAPGKHNPYATDCVERRSVSHQHTGAICLICSPANALISGPTTEE